VDLGLQGKTGLVLGAGGGLGAAIARALAREGARVAIADISPEALKNTAKEIEDGGGTALPIAWDLRDLAAIDANVRQVEDKFGPVDVFVGNTGGPPPTAAAGQPLDLWSQQFQSMVLSVVGIADRVLPAMRARKWGRIVTSTSSGVVAPIPNLAISNSLRLTLVGWSKTLAREVAREGVTVNIAVPGRILTSRLRSIDEQRAKRENRTVEQVVADSTASIPIGRYGEPDEYAAMVAFLAGTPASYVTGAVIRIDGGLIASI
jgi:3-oxoacyl-[acyl-carrier protein] reductase